MAFISVKCYCCGKVVYRSRGRINEAKKFGWKTYCSTKCQSRIKNKQKLLKCSRLGCNNTFTRRLSDLKESELVYCSRSCAVTVNNSKYPKNPGVRKKCDFCGKEFVSRKKYCSKDCKDKGMVVTKEKIINLIKGFYKKEGRIPLKREFPHYHAARGRFGSWNDAISAAGYNPNPVMFAKKYIANDGHKCDSLAEKIVDDWLYSRNIKHEINVSYPGNHKLTVDFKIGKYWVEFFGLSGEHKRYDELKDEKLALAEKHNLNLLAIYPKDLFPKSRLNEVLNMLIN